MATKIGSLFGDISLRTANLDKGIASIGKKLKKLGGEFDKLGKSLTLKLTAPILGFGALSVKAFVEQEKAEASLRAALAASGQEVEKNMQTLKRMASEIQRVTTVGDEMSLSMAQQGISMGLQAEDMDKATRGAIGLSKAFNLDLKMAMRASSAALLGQTEMLTRYIPELKNIEDPAERVALVHAKMAEGFTLATAEADTTGGKLAQLKNAFGDLQEQIGEIIAEYLTPLVAKLRGIITELENADPAMVRLGVQIAGIVAVVGPLLLIMGKLIAILTTTWVWVGALGVGLGVIIDKIGFMQEAGEALGQLLIDIWSGDVVASIGSLIALLGELIELFTGPFGLSFSADRVRQDFINLFSTAKRWADNLVSSLKSVLDFLGKIAAKMPGYGLGQDIGNFVGGLMYRAKGGPVSGGSPYIVGEQGPELFVPGMSGGIVPNHALSALGGSQGGGQTINMSFNGVGMEIQSFIKNHRSQLGQIAVQAVRENNLRTV